MNALSPCYIWQDLPDNDIIRVDDTYYMVSTSMHSMPGCPIMRSRDLMNWETVSYVFTVLEDNPPHRLEDGRGVYGKGSWAASLRYIGGRFYCLFNSQDMHHAYIYSTDDPCRTGWERHELPAYMHDPALLADTDGRKYVIYGNGELRICELSQDMTSLLTEAEGGFDRPLLSGLTENIMLRIEGTHAYHIGDYYYLLCIEWPRDGHFRRREVCYRSHTLMGPYERQVILDEDFGYHNAGVAQGCICDRPDGSWFACMFQDHGAVGRIPYFLNMHWENDWPVIETDIMPVPAPLTKSRCEAVGKGYLSEAQWNHDPNMSTVRFSSDGTIELQALSSMSNGYAGILTARNTLTWRTHGPRCSISARIDYTELRSGDTAGLVAMQGQFGLIGIRMTDTPHLIMSVNDGSYGERVCEAIVPDGASDRTLSLRIAFNFEDNIDLADFYYSIDGTEWTRIGETLHMKYTLDQFMGYRMGVFCYGSEQDGGKLKISDVKI